MRRTKMFLSNTLTPLLFLMIVTLIGCAPATVLPTSPPKLGCNEGGDGVFTPEDVQCYLDNLGSNQVQYIDVNTAFLLSNTQSIDDWVGAAIIYHIPTRSMLVLDKFGDIDPLTSVFTNRAGLAAISELVGDSALMAGLKQQVELNLQTTPSHQPEIRLSAAWQDGQTTIFLITVAGLDPYDERFYCPNQTWNMGDIIEEIVVDCIPIQEENPVNRVFFESKTIRGNSEIPVQVALNGVQSNIIQVQEGNPARESAIYRAVLEHFSSRPLIIRDETTPGYDYSSDLESKDIPSSVLQNYLAVNQIISSLRFLFQNSEYYFTTPGENITRYYLQGNPNNPQQVCEQFHNEYPGLGSVVSLSQIGFNEDGSQAMVHILLECNKDETRRAAYVLLSQIDGKWQVWEEIPATSDLPAIIPEMDYINQAEGCGDIFVYKSNHNKSEFILVSIDARNIQLSESPVTLNFAEQSELIGARIEIYSDTGENLGENPYCNDIGQSLYPQSVWQATSGILTITANANVETESCIGEPYLVTILIEKVTFALDDQTVYLPSLLFKEVTVGWCAG